MLALPSEPDRCALRNRPSRQILERLVGPSAFASTFRHAIAVPRQGLSEGHPKRYPGAAPAAQ
jgi:hypothetical protein